MKENIDSILPDQVPTSDEAQNSNDSQPESSRKSLSLISTILLLFGSVYGTGVYISVDITIHYIPSLFYSLLMWFVGGMVALGASLCYVELALLLPSCGGEYAYFNEAYHEIVGFSFMMSNLLFIRPISIAVLVLYAAEVIFEAALKDKPFWPCRLTSIGIVWCLFILHSCSNKYSIKLNNFLTYLKFLVLLFIVGIASYKLCTGQTEHIQDWGFKAQISPLLLGNGFYSVMWAYDGFNVLVYMVEEMKNINNIKIASVIALVGVTIMYLMMSFSYVVIVGIEGLLHFNGVVNSIARPYIKDGSYVIMALLSLSALGSANGAAYSSAR
ncbi:Y+L amino acid transporter 2 [Thelohanellus kitauei]|uniref:Y+L amino acid transporter 2 n=1 Tax=Thelohanellus kitauei TaxID=669202 RepID=A0A0C2JYP1_THEKT|nr:Y+L amino acid transporter 2 [Thelohanellus kitauei]